MDSRLLNSGVLSQRLVLWWIHIPQTDAGPLEVSICEGAVFLRLHPRTGFAAALFLSASARFSTALGIRKC